jgi:hypothetical protein
LASSPLSGLLGNKEIQDIFFWQTLGAIIQAALAPEIIALQQESFRLTPTLVLNSAQLAEAVVRGYLDQAAAEDLARQSGFDKQPFDTIVSLTGQPLPLDALTEAWRRKIIAQSGLGPDSTSLEQGIRESALKNKWLPVVEALQFRLADPGVVIEAWLRAVIPEPEARERLRQAGIDEETGTLMFKASGRPPSPQELQELYHRGLIGFDETGPDALSLRQGFLETDLKDKWWPKWQHLGDYLPPPRTVTALIREGALSDAQGLDYFKKSGLGADLAAVYVAAAHHQKVAADKELAKADVLRLYAAKQMSVAQAEAALTLLGWSPANIGFLLGYEDFKAEIHLVDQALARLRSLYLGHKITKGAVAAAIDTLGLDAAARDNLLKFWDVDRNATPVLLSAAELAQGAALGLLDAGGVLDELGGRGFDARDAYIFLATHKVDLTGLPIPAGVKGA